MKKIILFLILISNQLLIAQNTPWDEETPPIILECANGDIFEISILDLLSNTVVLDSIYSLCGEEGIDEDWNGPDWDDDFWNFDSTDVDEGEDWPLDEDSIDGNNPLGEEDLFIELMCSNGEVYQVNLLDMVDSPFEETITALCGEEGIDEDWNGPDWDDDFWNFDSTEVENPDAYTCFEDVFPGIGNIDFETMYPNMEMTNEDFFFIIEDTDVDFSVFTENGIEFTAQEMDGYLLFGPISIDDLISFVIGLGMDESSIPWGYFRPANNEVVAQGILNKDNMELPNNFSMSFEAPSSVVDIIVGSPDHTTLAAAVGAAGLVETLSGDGPFTVFAPTDAAFALLPEGLVATLLEDPSGQLTTILTHHVYAGLALSTDLYDGMMVPTIAGGALEVTFPMEMVHIGDAMVTTADLQADNGVVHVINAVLIPEEGLSIHESLLLEDNAEY